MLCASALKGFVQGIEFGQELTVVGNCVSYWSPGYGLMIRTPMLVFAEVPGVHARALFISADVDKRALDFCGVGEP